MKNDTASTASAVSAAAETEPRTASFVKIRKKSCGRKRMTTAATEMRTLRNKTQTQKSRRSPGVIAVSSGTFQIDFIVTDFIHHLLYLVFAKTEQYTSNKNKKLLMVILLLLV